MIFNNVRLLAFDADDTLWDCQSHFQAVERRYCGLLKPYAEAETICRELFRTEQGNMPLLGYGAQAFTISLMENALEISGGRLTAAETREIIGLGKSLLRLPATPLPEVRDTLEALGGYRKVVFTKGEPLDQQRKLERSGLSEYFCDAVIVADKTEREYLRLCRLHSVRPEEMLMVGNSFRSDVAPALSVGACAVHIPFHVTWQMERADEYAHERLATVSRFSEILDLLP